MQCTVKYKRNDDLNKKCLASAYTSTNGAVGENSLPLISKKTFESDKA